MHADADANADGQWPCDLDHDLYIKNSQFWILYPPGALVLHKHTCFCPSRARCHIGITLSVVRHTLLLMTPYMYVFLEYLLVFYQCHIQGSWPNSQNVLVVTTLTVTHENEFQVNNMARWTPDRSSVLSAMLDDVVGTQEVVTIRQDFCRIWDCLLSKRNRTNTFFTGSQAEGLELPGSDLDFMVDHNDLFRIKIIQSLEEISNTSLYNIFLMSTENVPPGFALLQHVNQALSNQILLVASQNMNGILYLNSDLMIESYLSLLSQTGEPITRTRQGPAIESWTEYEDKSKSGTDNVLSIHCDFWPTMALEWTQRPRHFGWPSSHDISTIINFGCHLVPLGHPHSDTKLLEWRISFSVAERIIVWSFNHVQMQCYAVMKIILKEFIKVRCSPQNNVLCSYFIKTFLFWKYETNDVYFWRADNFRECLMYLLKEFSQCLHEGVLRHYFIPIFNLLSVKFTRAAQIELLHLFDIIIQSDISVLRECKTLQNIWSALLRVGENKNKVLQDIKRRNMLMNDDCMMKLINPFDALITLVTQLHDQYDVTSSLLYLPCKSHLKTFVLNRCLFWIHVRSLLQYDLKNKDVYQLHQTCKSDTFSTDISSIKLWCAIVLFMKKDFSSVLNITNEILSSIPPFVIYNYENMYLTQSNNENEQLYDDMFLDSDTTVMERARQAWMFHLFFIQDMADVVPLAIQIELYFNDPVLTFDLSPLSFTYYLQFLCYHSMRQYDSRKSALLQLIEQLTENEPITLNETYHKCNIAGHCLLLAGERALAWEMFNKSYQLTQWYPEYHKYNSVVWYLQNCFWTNFHWNPQAEEHLFNSKYQYVWELCENPRYNS